jgi:hypothetical protein
MSIKVGWIPKNPRRNGGKRQTKRLHPIRNEKETRWRMKLTSDPG